MYSPVNCIKHLRRKLYEFSTISPRRQKQREYILIHSEVSIILILNPDKSIKTKQNYRPIFLKNYMQKFSIVYQQIESNNVLDLAECQRINGFELWCWRRLLRVPWTARSNQSILKEISPEYSLEGLMLNLKYWIQYFGYLMRITDSLEMTLTLGKIEGRRRRG